MRHAKRLIPFPPRSWRIGALIGLGLFAGSTVRLQGLGSIVPGDVDDDARVTVSDAVLVLQFIVQQTMLTSEQIRTADVNGDGRVDISDVIGILRAALGLTPEPSIPMLPGPPAPPGPVTLPGPPAEGIPTLPPPPPTLSQSTG